MSEAEKFLRSIKERNFLEYQEKVSALPKEAWAIIKTFNERNGYLVGNDIIDTDINSSLDKIEGG